jgi:hypothetical protein
MPYTAPMFSFIETRLFTKLVVDYLSDEEYAALQLALMRDPEASPVIPGSGAGSKASMGSSRAGKARWVPGDLLCSTHQRRALDANDVPEECRGKHFCARPSTDQEGS